MDVYKERRSIRKYKADQVPQELVDQVIEAGLYAASGVGSQSPIIIQVKDPEMREELKKANAAIMGRDVDPFFGAPVVLIVIADKAGKTYLYDGCLTMGNMMLKAKELGLGSCWVHRAKQEFEGEIGRKILNKLGLTGEYEGIGHLTLGYPDEQPAAKPRKEGRVFTI